jgi:hypothetical protein
METGVTGWVRRLRRAAAGLTLGVLGLGGLLAGCGGGEATSPPPGSVQRAAADGGTEPAGRRADATPPRLRIAAVATPRHPPPRCACTTAARTAGDGWQIHTWNAAQSPNWNAGWNAAGSDDFGVYYDVPLATGSGTVGFLLHNGDNKDNGGADQSYVLQAGANEIWRLQGDSTSYASNPLLLPVPAVRTVRVHYKRFDGLRRLGPAPVGQQRAGHQRLPAGVNIDLWNQPVPSARCRAMRPATARWSSTSPCSTRRAT